MLAFLPDGAVCECHGANRIDLAPVLPDFELTADELFKSLSE